MLLIKGGLLHTMTGEDVRQADILTEGSRILAVAEQITPVDEHTEVIDARGLHVCPGLVETHAHITAAETRWYDALQESASAAGVTTMALWQEDTGLCCLQHGGEPATPAWTLDWVHPEQLSDDELIAQAAAAVARGAHVAAEVHGTRMIRRMLLAKRETGCGMLLVHATDGAELAGEIAASGCGVILGACTQRGHDDSYRLAHTLQQAGVTVAVTTDHPAMRLHYLPLCAGLCTRAGMSAENALRTVTCDAAALLGLGEQCGKIIPGMRADLVLYDGVPMRLATDRVMTILGGKQTG